MNLKMFCLIGCLLTSFSIFGVAPSEKEEKDSSLNQNCEISNTLSSQILNNGVCEDKVDPCCEDYFDQWDLWLYPTFLTVGYTAGDSIFYQHGGYTTVGLFFGSPSPLLNCYQPFFDVKGHYFNEGKWGGSVGGGMRLLISDHLVLGANVYYDFRRLHQFHLHQIGVGVELLGPRWDLRINGYIPIHQIHDRKTVYNFGDNFFAIRNKRVSAWSGVDAEIGTWIIRKFPYDTFGIYCAAGPYYYFREKHPFDEKKRDAIGGRVRLLARMCSFIDLAVNATFDSVWHTKVEGQLTITIPFDWQLGIRNVCDPCECSPCLIEQIATQPVYRNGIIHAEKDCTWRWNWSDCCSGSGCPSSEKSSSCKCSGGYTTQPYNSCDFSSSFFDHSSRCSKSSKKGSHCK